MVVTLLTDFGLEDEYAGVVKGVLLKINPSATIVDISHKVPPGDVEKASWLLAWSWPYFPKGTIHLVVVDPGVGTRRRILCFRHGGHTFLGPDNGVLSRVLAGVRRPALYAVTNRRYTLASVSNTFHGRDIWAPAAGHLSKGLSPSRLGPRVNAWKRLPMPSCKAGKGRLTGRVIFCDRFGNAVTSVSSSGLKRKGKGPVRVHVRVKGLDLPLLKSYAAVPPGAPLAVVGSRGFLEISVNRGSARDQLRLKLGDSVEVRG